MSLFSLPLPNLLKFLAERIHFQRNKTSGFFYPSNDRSGSNSSIATSRSNRSNSGSRKSRRCGIKETGIGCQLSDELRKATIDKSTVFVGSERRCEDLQGRILVSRRVEHINLGLVGGGGEDEAAIHGHTFGQPFKSHICRCSLVSGSNRFSDDVALVGNEHDWPATGKRRNSWGVFKASAMSGI